MKILTHPQDKQLRQVCKQVVKFDKCLCKLVDEMVELMREHDGVGLAAPQVGDARRFFVMEYDDQLYKIINPTIKSKSDEVEVMEEGCLSLPEVLLGLERASSICVEFFDVDGQSYEADIDGFLARIFQHEYDHLDGKLIVDHIDYGLIE